MEFGDINHHSMKMFFTQYPCSYLQGQGNSNLICEV